MAQPVRSDPFERTLQRIISSTTAEIAAAVQRNISEEVERLLRTSGQRRGALAGKVRQRRTIFCPVPKCGKPGGGPKWGWFCAEHKGLPEPEKRRMRALRRSGEESESTSGRGASGKVGRGKKRTASEVRRTANEKHSRRAAPARRPTSEPASQTVPVETSAPTEASQAQA